MENGASNNKLLDLIHKNEKNVDHQHWSRNVQFSFHKGLMDSAAERTYVYVCKTSDTSLCAVDLVMNRPSPAVPRSDFLGLGERLWVMLLETGLYVYLRNPKCRLVCLKAHKAKLVWHNYADLREICQTAGCPVLSLSINHWNESMRAQGQQQQQQREEAIHTPYWL